MDNPIRSKFLISVLRWVDSEAAPAVAEPCDPGKRVEWLRILPFIVLHAMCLGVFWVGWSWAAVATATVLYLVRMFAITGFYHRYFSHKTYQTNRFWQFIFAVLGNSAVQRGPLWWASHHRHHHRFADTDEDPHSPSRQGFWWEIDITYYLLKLMSGLGMVWSLRPVPEHVRKHGRAYGGRSEGTAGTHR